MKERPLHKLGAVGEGNGEHKERVTDCARLFTPQNIDDPEREIVRARNALAQHRGNPRPKSQQSEHQTHIQKNETNNHQNKGRVSEPLLHTLQKKSKKHQRAANQAGEVGEMKVPRMGLLRGEREIDES